MGVSERVNGGHKAVFFDRDGVLNHAIVRDGKPFPPSSLSELHIVEDAQAELNRLVREGFILICITNQPDVARGTLKRDVVESINEAIGRALPLKEIRVCYHDEADHCRCRKPEPGLLVDSSEKFDIDLPSSYMVGDRWRDIEAGKRAGCRPIWIDRGYKEKQPDPKDAVFVSSLKGAVDHIVETQLQEWRQSMTTVADLKIKIFADGADERGMLEMYQKPFISGFTTNPTLMRKAGISNYEEFAKDILGEIPDRPISFEVFSDEFEEMYRQARKIAAWGTNVYVKIPVTNTQRQSSAALVKRLSHEGIKLNITAVLSLTQVREIAGVLAGDVPAYVSVFAGRVADTGRDPLPLMTEALEILKPLPNAELIWASPRELLNVFQADAIGCHIITVTNDILKKLVLVGKDLGDYSLETVKMFYVDAQQAGFLL